MKLKNKIYDFIFHVLLGTTLAVALSVTLISASVFEVPNSILLGYCFVFQLILQVILLNKKTGLAGGIILFLGVSVLFFSLWRNGFQNQWFLVLKNSVQEIVWAGKDIIPYNQEYNDLLAFGAALGTSLVTAFSVRFAYGFYFLIPVALGVFGVPLYKEWNISHMALLIFLFCFVVLLFQKLNLYAYTKTKGKRNVQSIYSLLLIPVGLVIFFISWKLPKPEVKTWDFLVRNQVNHYTAPKQTMTFTEKKKRLGGPNRTAEFFVMEVESEDDTMYLKGSAYDTYNGFGWEHSEPREVEYGDFPDNIEDYSPDLINAQNYYSNVYGWPKKQVTVSIKDQRTTKILTAPNSSNFSNNTPSSYEMFYIGKEEGTLWVEKPLPANSTYTQEYISWDDRDPNYLWILRSKSYSIENNQPWLEPYLQLPDELPERVGDLAQTLTQNVTNDYDRMKELERYLKVTYPYTLLPNSVPSGTDFVDYFLFEEKQGYCVYYASALAVMGRTLGIPTRYVEGYAMPPERNDEGNFTVTSKQAHAWTEAYFPQIGWVRFEPTGQSPDTNTGIDNVIETNPDPVVPPTPEKPLDIEEKPELLDPEIPQKPAKEVKKMGIGIKILLVVLLLIGMTLSILYIRYKQFEEEENRLNRLSNKDAVIAYFGKILKVADVLGFSISEGETVLQYSQRVEDELSTEEISFVEVGEIFSRASYSMEAISQEEAECMKLVYQELLSRVQLSQSSKGIFFWKERILHKF